MKERQEPHISAPAASATRDQDVRLNQALEEFCAAAEAGQALTKADLLEKYADVADELSGCLASLDFIRHMAPQLKGAADFSEDSPGSPIQPLATLGDFRILHEIGRGGMGVVYEAEQLSIGRRVALKVLPFAALLDAQQLNRFKNEARAAASLDHPNIVAVHSVGEERGVHYYAMRLVEGQSLAEVIADQQKSCRTMVDEVAIGDGPAVALEAEEVDTDVAETEPEQPPSESPASPLADTKRAPQALLSTAPKADTRAYFRSVAQLGVQAAQALDHAHQNGIVHRDVKPANLLVNSEGKLWVTDFGLARIESDASFTMTGDILGTLRYMSPEQAQATRAVLDHRTDIYSLGVTLYELLTLQPAFHSENRQELLRKIAQDEPISPRKINPAIPRNLVTIVGKSMEKRPEDRYRTAQAMADDLTCFLHDRPIHVKPHTLATRVVKWTRRHKYLVASAAVLLVLSSIVLSVSNVMVTRERDQKDAALQASEANLSRALDAVDKLLTNITDKRILNAPHMGPVQREMAEEALSLCDVLLKQNPNDPRVSHRNAAVRLQKGNIHRKLGEYEAAEKALRKASLQLQQLAKQTDDPADKEKHEAVLLKSQLQLGSVLEKMGRYQESANVLSEALALGKRLIATHPQTLQYSATVGDVYSSLGYTGLGLGRHGLDQPVKSGTAWREANRILKRIVWDHPDKTEYCVSLAGSYINLALCGKNPKESFEEAVRLMQHVLDKEPANVKAKSMLANIYGAMAQWQKKDGHLAEARRNFQHAIAICEELSGEHPLVPYYRSALGKLYGSQGKMADEAGDKEKSLHWNLQAVTALESALLQHDPDVEAQEDLVLALTNSGNRLRELNRCDEWDKVCDKSIAVLRALAKAHPTKTKYRQQLATAHFNKTGAMEGSGMSRLSEEKEQMVLARYQVALDARRQLAKDNPDDSNHTIELAYIMRVLGDFHARQGRGREGQAAYQDAMAILGNVPEDERQRPSWRVQMGNVLSDIGSEENLRDAIRLFEDLVKENIENENAYHQTCLAEIMRKLAHLLEDGDRADEAEQPLRKAIQIREELVASAPSLGGRVYLVGPIAECYGCLGHLLKTLGRPAECIDAYQQAITTQTMIMRRWPSEWAFFNLLEFYGKVCKLPCAEEQIAERLQWQQDWLAAYEEFETDFPDELNSDDPRVSKPTWQNSIAWNLVISPHARLRNTGRAVELAQKVVKHAPQKWWAWNTLGVAQYRAGNWEESIKTLERSTELRSGGDSIDWFFLAMAHWQLGQQDEARRWYDRAVEWMEANKPDDEELRRFRTEAAEMLNEEGGRRKDETKDEE